MTNLFELAKRKSNAAEFTVSDLSAALKKTVEGAFGYVRVRGEVSGYRGPHASGHTYFALKDEKARLEAVIWRGAMGKFRFKLEEGMEVIATGKLTIYPGSSKYQLVIDAFEPAGAGALMALLEERKRKLAAEGLFDEARKQPLPFMPTVIGVVTSPTGAVIRDIIHRISDRFPLHILVWPVRVQGETSGAEVAAAIKGFNELSGDGITLRPDLIIVARGGGSLEDLWGFNDEIVVRAVAQSHLPVISAVGHQTDWTLIDHVADKRAPTPTGAAEMAVPVKAELESALSSLNVRLNAGLSRLLTSRRERLSGLVRGLPTVDQMFALPRQRHDEATNRLSRAFFSSVNQKKSCFDGFSRQFSSFLILRPLQEKQRRLTLSAERLRRVFLVGLDRQRHIYQNIARRSVIEMLIRIISRNRQRFIPLLYCIEIEVRRILKRNRQSLDEFCRLIKTLSHENVLERGFILVFDSQNQLVKKAHGITQGETLTLRFADDQIKAIVHTEKAVSGDGHAETGICKNRNNSDNQGTLF
ncbi:MAG: exodeoxyribonuclease VII large subunit [Candidatus Tokpelaia sp. JSC189]|nr:MAG: exodeoxyribonuclease VII large subunit [Candidatus Tokpelaia sp. JSC189]